MERMLRTILHFSKLKTSNIILFAQMLKCPINDDSLGKLDG